MNSKTLANLPSLHLYHEEDLANLIYIEGTLERPGESGESGEMKLVCFGDENMIFKLYEQFRDKLVDFIAKIILTQYFESTMGTMIKTPFINKNHPNAGPWSAIGVIKMLQVPNIKLGGNQNLRSKIATSIEYNIKDKVVVSAMEYKPYSDRQRSTQTFVNDIGHRVLNTFIESDITPVQPADATPFIRHVEYLCDKDAGMTEHLLNWLAYSVQYPERKIGHAVLLGSRQGGTGKSLLLNTMAIIMGRTNVNTINVRDLRNSKQDWFINKTMVIVEEVKDLNLSDMNNLKTLITEPFIMADKKFGAYQQETNHANFMFTSNFERSLYLPDSANARRYFVVFSEQKPKEDTYYCSLAIWLEQDDGYGKTLAFLMDRNLTEFNAMGAPPETAAKTKLMANSKTDIELYVQQWANGIDDEGDPAVAKVFTYKCLLYALGLSPYKNQCGRARRISEFLVEGGCVKKRIYMSGGAAKTLWFNALAIEADMVSWPYRSLQKLLHDETSPF